MKLYFGNTISTVTTLSILLLIVFIIFAAAQRGIIVHWGLMSLILLIFGLAICCLAATRDGLDKTVQHTIDGSCNPGIFPLLSFPNIIGCIGALMIIVAAIAVPISSSLYSKQIWFYIMTGGVVLKIVTVEIARIFVNFSH